MTRINPNSLKNLKPGANDKGKVRVTLTLEPRTIALLKMTGNMSEAVDKLINLCCLGFVKHDGSLNPPVDRSGRNEINPESKDAHDSIDVVLRDKKACDRTSPSGTL